MADAMPVGMAARSRHMAKASLVIESETALTEA
jgi:hypothetical protein